VLDYNPDKGGYIVPMSQDVLEQAPTTRLEDVTKNDSDLRTRTYDFYKAPHYWE
jgi:hypothetical protein